MYAANGEFSLNACRKLIMRSVKKSPARNKSANGVETDKLQIAKLNLTCALTSRSERISLIYDGRICLQTIIFT